MSSIILGRTEYSPLRPEATRIEKFECSDMYISTSLSFFDSDIQRSKASLALIPIESSLCTKGISNEKIVNLK